MLKMSGISELSLPSRSHRHRAVFAAARSFVTVLAMALAIALLAGEAAWADCTPASANNVTATCTGTTTNQGGGAPGTSAGTNGYGIGTETGVTVTVNNGASVTGTSAFSAGIGLGDATVTNNAGATVTGGQFGIVANNGVANVTNSGGITGIIGIFAFTNATVTNNAGATITGGNVGISTDIGFANVTNSGSITGTAVDGIYAQTNATVTNNAGATVTGGQYGIYAVAGGSSVLNAGMISGGTAAISFFGSGNTLTLAPGSVISGNVLGTGSDTFQLGGTGAATFDISQLGPAAQYQGFGTFNKIGSSVWTLTGTSSFAGPVNVSGGTLSVNGDISSASSLTVNAGGTLGGIGIVGNTTINGGTLAPGNSIGTLTVSGSLTLTAAATYLVQVQGTISDKTIVTGTANLGGAVVVDPLARLTQKTTYTILTSVTLNGTFNSLSFLMTNNLARNPVLSYVGNDVLLTLDPGLLTPILPANAAVNHIKVAGAIDNALVGGSNLSNAFGAIFNLNGNTLLGGLTQLSGETATGSQQTTFDAMTQFMGVMTDPFIGGRSDGVGASGGAPTGYVSTQKTGADRDANAMFVKVPVVPFEQRWSTWVAGFGGSQTTDGNAAVGSNSTTSSIAGTAVGADYRFSPFTIAGFALAGGGTNFSVANGGSGRSDLFQAGAFVRHTVGQAYITGALAYGWQDVTTNRTVSVAGIDHLRAEFNANAFSGRVEGGYRFVAPWNGGFGITPYAAGQFTTFDLPAYAESVVSGASTFALAYGSKSVTDTRSELGIRTDKSYALQDSVLTLRGRFAWAHDFNPDRSIGATFQTLPAASFVVNGAAQAHDSALTTASAEMKWPNGWSAAATFEGEFSEVTRSYAGKGVVRYQW
jgi:uncharacterized protein with beta-barrel porin domain